MIFRMSEDDDHDFILKYLNWMKGSTLQADSLHIYNFGYERGGGGGEREGPSCYEEESECCETLINILLTNISSELHQ